MVARVCLFVLISAAMLCRAQPAPPTERPRYELKGRVVEVGGTAGVYGARISVERYTGPAVSSFDERERLGEAETAADGRFAFPVAVPGTYRLRVERDGYCAPGSTIQSSNWTEKEVTLSSQRPTGQVDFTLARPGRISGRIVDEDTKAPVPGIQVRVLQFNYMRGRVIFWHGGAGVTDNQGRFLVLDLPPARYVVSIKSRFHSPSEIQQSPELHGRPALLTAFAEGDLEATDKDYGTVYWPGGPEAADVLPLPLASGEDRNLGNVEIRKTPAYRVKLSIGGQCKVGQQVSILARRLPAPMTERVGTSVCGGDVLLLGFPPGSYVLTLHGDPPAMGGAEFVISDRSISVSSPLSDGVELGGTVTVPGAAVPPDLTAVRVTISPRWEHMMNMPVSPGVSGRFVFQNVPVREFEVEVDGLPEGYFVKEIRYNGSPLRGNFMSIDASAPSHKLEIAVSDSAASLAGTVFDGDVPLNRPRVVLVRWPAAQDLYASFVEAEATTEGRFSFSGLAPGQYRICALSRDDRFAADDPNLLPGLVAHGKTVSLEQKAHVTLDLKVSRP